MRVLIDELPFTDMAFSLPTTVWLSTLYAQEAPLTVTPDLLRTVLFFKAFCDVVFPIGGLWEEASVFPDAISPSC